MRQTIIGFDSAWAGNAPGGICALSFEDSKVTAFKAPQLVRFDEAITFIRSEKEVADYLLIALDQPTLVPNSTGIRPVERVAGSIVNRLGGGVQPANTSKTAMFGPDAPIWNFLKDLRARQNPNASRSARTGVFLIEVFPALALPSLVPEIWHRQRAAKYNPAVRNFLPSDWQLVTDGVRALALREGLTAVADTLQQLAQLARPAKGDQDKLDAVLSLMIGYLWRFGEPKGSVVIGDALSGYMVTPAAPEIRTRLCASAKRLNVPFDQSFGQDAPLTVPPAFPRGADTRNARAVKIKKQPAPGARQCPECQHVFSGTGWGGIDAHWRAKHQNIMAYTAAWPLIRKGLKPSEFQQPLTAQGW